MISESGKKYYVPLGETYVPSSVVAFFLRSVAITAGCDREDTANYLHLAVRGIDTYPPTLSSLDSDFIRDSQWVTPSTARGQMKERLLSFFGANAWKRRELAKRTQAAYHNISPEEGITVRYSVRSAFLRSGLPKILLCILPWTVIPVMTFLMSLAPSGKPTDIMDYFYTFAVPLAVPALCTTFYSVVMLKCLISVSSHFTQNRKLRKHVKQYHVWYESVVGTWSQRENLPPEFSEVCDEYVNYQRAIDVIETTDDPFISHTMQEYREELRADLDRTFMAKIHTIAQKVVAREKMEKTRDDEKRKQQNIYSDMKQRKYLREVEDIVKHMREDSSNAPFRFNIHSLEYEPN